MSEIQLSNLPGYQPEGIVDCLDAYFIEKQGTTSDPLGHISHTILQESGWAISPDAIAESIANIREQTKLQQGTATYVGALASRLVAASTDRLIRTPPSEATALTTLFRDEYGVDLTPYMEQSTNMLGITGMASRGSSRIMDLNYMALRETHGNAFWQLTVNGDYGFVNMTCVSHDFPAMPVRGRGNIAHIPGVKEALAADTAFIEAHSVYR